MPSTTNLEIAKALNENARRLLDAADAAAGAGLFGVARSLALLAYEETIHGVVHYWVEEGWATFDPSQSGKALYIDQALLRDHPMKQFLIFLFDFGLFGLARDVAQEVAEGKDPGIQPKEAVEAMVKEAAAAPLPTWKFNSWKNEGFYVGGDGSTIRSPGDVTEDDFRSIRDRIEVRWRFARAVEATPLREADIEEVRRNATLGGMRLDEPFLRQIHRMEGRVGRESLWAEWAEKLRSGEHITFSSS